MLGAIRLTPQRIHENPNAAAGGSQVLDLVRRNPVVDRAAAHADHFARLHDAYCLPFHWGCLHRVVSEAASVRLGVQPLTGACTGVNILTNDGTPPIGGR